MVCFHFQASGPGDLFLRAVATTRAGREERNTVVRSMSQRLCNLCAYYGEVVYASKG